MLFAPDYLNHAARPSLERGAPASSFGIGASLHEAVRSSVAGRHIRDRSAGVVRHSAAYRKYSGACVYVGGIAISKLVKRSGSAYLDTNILNQVDIVVRRSLGTTLNQRWNLTRSWLRSDARARAWRPTAETWFPLGANRACGQGQGHRASGRRNECLTSRLHERSPKDLPPRCS